MLRVPRHFGHGPEAVKDRDIAMAKKLRRFSVGLIGVCALLCATAAPTTTVEAVPDDDTDTEVESPAATLDEQEVWPASDIVTAEDTIDELIAVVDGWGPPLAGRLCFIDSECGPLLATAEVFTPSAPLEDVIAQTT